MGIWKLEKVTSAISKLNVTDDRESENLAGWVWEEIMHFSSGAEKDISDVEEEKINNAIQRIGLGEPIQYIAGHAWFYGIKLKVTPDVLIPRPETEELVSWIIEDLKESPKTEIRILDIGTGSGCIAIALKKHLKSKATVLAIDISQSALNVATVNATHSEVDITFLQRDFLADDLTDLGLFDVIVSNPPYVSGDFSEEMKVNQLKYEPSLALYPAGEDVDIFYKKMAVWAGQSLLPDSSCYLELNEFRSGKIRGYFSGYPWSGGDIRKDLQGSARMLRVRN